MDLGPHRGKGPRFLYRVRPRHVDLGPSRLPRPDRARNPLGRQQGRRLRQPAPSLRPAQTICLRGGRREHPAIPARHALGDARRAGPPDAEARRAGRVDGAHGLAPRVRGPAFRLRARDCQADLHGLGPPRPALGRGDPRLSQRDAAPGPRPRPDHHLRGHRRRFPGRQVHGLRGQAEHSHQPDLRPRRCRRPPAPGHPLPQGHRRGRQGRRPRDPLHRLGDRRHARRPEQPTLWVRQLALRDRRILRLPGADRRRTHGLPPGSVPVQGRRLEAGVPPEHEQQLMGRWAQRRGADLRLDGQRMPERFSADPQPLLRIGPGRIVAGAPEHRRLEPVLPRDRQGPAGRFPRRVHRRGGPCALHGADLPQALLEQHGFRRRADRAPGGHLRAREARDRLRRAQRLEPARQRRRMDRTGAGRGRARWQRLGDRLVQLHRPAQPHAPGVQDRQRGGLRDSAPRQGPWADLPGCVHLFKTRNPPSARPGRLRFVACRAEERQPALADARSAPAGRAGPARCRPRAGRAGQRPRGRCDWAEPGCDPRPLDAPRSGRDRPGGRGRVEAPVGRGPPQCAAGPPEE